MTVWVGGCLQGWFPLTGLPWNLPAVPGIFMGPPPTFDGTSSQAYQVAMSLIKILKYKELCLRQITGANYTVVCLYEILSEKCKIPAMDLSTNQTAEFSQIIV